MKTFKKIISVAVVVCFLSSNIAQAGGGDIFTLAPPSRFSHLQGPEFKEVAQIEIGIRQSLKDLESFNIDELKALGAKAFKENTIFGARIAGKIRFDQIAEVQIPSSGIYAEKGSYLIKADTGGRTYYCLVAKPADRAHYDVSVVSERVLNLALEKGTVKFTGESLDEKDRSIINTYIEHETSTGNNEAIDEWIKERMVRGAYAVDNITAKENPLYKHAKRDTYNRGKYTGLIENVTAFLKAAGVENENVEPVINAMRSTPLVLIPYENEDNLPRINMNGLPTVVNAHSSQFATYIFIPQALYENIKQGQPLEEAAGYVEALLVHEVGARCGLKSSVKNGEFRNVLDEKFAVYQNERSLPVGEVPEEIKNLSPVNLLELQLRNDYAAGGWILKIIFMAAMALVIATQGCELPTGPEIITPEEPVEEEPVEEEPVEEERSIQEIKTAILIHQFHYISEFSTSQLIEFSAQSVVKALVEIGQPAVAPLIEDLKRGSGCAAIALGGIGDKAAVQPLIEALKDSNRFAAIALGEIGDKESVQPLIEALKDGKFSVRGYAALALGEIGDEAAVQPLIEVLKDESEWVRIKVAEALGEIGDEAAVQPLMESLKDESSSSIVRLSAAIALAKIEDKEGDESAGQLLIEALKDETTNVRSFAAKALGEIGDEAAVQPLIEALKDESSGVRASAALALGKIGDEVAVQPLIEALKDGKYSVRGYAALALIIIPGNDEYVRGYAALALGKIGDKAAVQPLIEALKDESIWIREFVTSALGEMGDEAAVQPLIEALEDEDKGVIANAIVSLMNIGGIQAIISLKDFVETNTSHNLDTRIIVLECLYYLGAYEVWEELNYYWDMHDSVKRSRSNNTSTCSYANFELANYKDKFAVDALIRNLKYAEYWQAPGDAAIALARTGDPRVYDELINALSYVSSDTYPWSVSASRLEGVIIGLGDLGDERAIEPLNTVAENEDEEDYIREAARDAIERIREAQESESEETSAIDKSFETTGKAAIAGLGRINETLRQEEVSSRIDEISEVLWQQVRGEITKEEARHELAELAPDAALSAGDRDAVYDTWMTYSASIMLFLGLTVAGKHKKPQDADIRAVAAVIADKEIEIFMPDSQFPKNVTRPFRNALNDIFGDRLRTYQGLDDLNKMVKNPAKSIVMTVDLKDEQIDVLKNAGMDLNLMRFMNFGPVNIGEMTQTEHENYIAETLSMLLVARAITPEDAQDQGSPMYQMLAHFLESHMQDTNEVGTYIRTMVDGSISVITKLRYLLKTVLRAVPITAYRIVKPAVEILWSA